MVKSKKMSKSAIAIIVLALLLVLSMVLGLTGAWFTDSKDTSDKSGKIEFGTVAVTASEQTFSYVGYESLSKMVDGDKVTVTAAEVQNASDVAIFYSYTIGYALYADEGCTTLASADQKALFKLKVGEASPAAYADATVTKYGFMVASDGDAVMGSQGALELILDSNGTANQKSSEQGNDSWTVIADGLYFKVTVTVKAVQAGNIDATDLASQLSCSSTIAEALIGYRGSSQSSASSRVYSAS